MNSIIEGDHLAQDKTLNSEECFGVKIGKVMYAKSGTFDMMYRYVYDENCILRGKRDTYKILKFD